MIAFAAFALVLTLLLPASAWAGTPTTTSSSPSAAGITLADAATDTATVTDLDALGAPTGNVSFSVCGPLPSATGCASGGTAVGSPVPVNPGLISSSAATSDSFTPTAAGTWCFRADYQGDSTFDASSDGMAGECFTVGQAASTTTSAPAQSSIALGDQNTDAVTVTGNTAGGSPSGTVNFFVCGPTASDCATGGTAFDSETLQGGAASSSSFTPSSPGTWCFRAEYAGDTNYTASSDGTAGECFTVGRAAAHVQSAPSTKSTTLAAGASDVVMVSGNAIGGTPTGSVSFFVCGPEVSDCTTAGTSLGVASLSGGSATSANFLPPAPGTYCFRAEYSGDTSYTTSSDGSAGECFTVVAPGAPTISITSPSGLAIYSVGQLVPAGYTCSPAAGDSGTATCAGSVPSGVAIDTSTPGHRAFNVTAQSAHGPSSEASVTYTVAGPPTASIFSPQDGASYTVGQGVPSDFGCSEGAYGPGLSSCRGPSRVDTMSLGSHSVTVTALSIDGQSGTRAVHYTVVLASNRFTVSALKPHRDGTVTLRITVPGGGTVKIVETARGTVFTKPRRGRVRFAFERLVPSGAGSFAVTVAPNARGRNLLRHHRMTVRIRLVITYTPTNGNPRSRTFSGLRVSP